MVVCPMLTNCYLRKNKATSGRSFIVDSVIPHHFLANEVKFRPQAESLAKTKSGKQKLAA